MNNSNGIPIIRPSTDEYRRIDYVVRGLAFAAHNEFGRLLDERLYQAELTERCRAAGLRAEREVKLRLEFASYRKDYFVDLLVNSVPFELKTVEAIAPAHRAQLLNYLFVVDLNHGTILNFRTSRVQHHYVSTQITREMRGKFELVEDSTDCELGRRTCELLLEVLSSWGTHLEVLAYQGVLMELLDGSQVDVPIYSRKIELGIQPMNLLSEDTTLSVTALKNTRGMRSNLLRLLEHTKLKSIVWVNLYQSSVLVTTLRKRRAK